MKRNTVKLGRDRDCNNSLHACRTVRRKKTDLTIKASREEVASLRSLNLLRVAKKLRPMPQWRPSGRWELGSLEGSVQLG